MNNSLTFWLQTRFWNKSPLVQRGMRLGILWKLIIKMRLEIQKNKSRALLNCLNFTGIIILERSNIQQSAQLCLSFEIQHFQYFGYNFCVLVLCSTRHQRKDKRTIFCANSKKCWNCCISKLRKSWADCWLLLRSSIIIPVKFKQFKSALDLFWSL